MSAAACKIIINDETYSAARRLTTLREQAVLAHQEGRLSADELDSLLFKMATLESNFIRQSKGILEQFLDLTNAPAAWRSLFEVV